MIFCMSDLMCLSWGWAVLSPNCKNIWFSHAPLAEGVKTHVSFHAGLFGQACVSNLGGGGLPPRIEIHGWRLLGVACCCLCVCLFVCLRSLLFCCARLLSVSVCFVCCCLFLCSVCVWSPVCVCVLSSGLCACCCVGAACTRSLLLALCACPRLLLRSSSRLRRCVLVPAVPRWPCGCCSPWCSSALGVRWCLSVVCRVGFVAARSAPPVLSYSSPSSASSSSASSSPLSSSSLPSSFVPLCGVVSAPRCCFRLSPPRSVVVSGPCSVVARAAPGQKFHLTKEFTR